MASPLLVAHVVADAPATPTAASVLAALAPVLPSHMVPDELRWHETLPTTPNGKVDRRLLAAMVGGAVPSAGIPSAPPLPTAPRAVAPHAASPSPSVGPDELRDAVMETWAEVLRVESVDPDRSFFDHGGNSLQVVTLRERLETRLAMPVSLVDLFRHATVRDFVAAHSASQDGGAVTAPDQATPDPAIAPPSGDDRATRRADARRRARRRS